MKVAPTCGVLMSRHGATPPNPEGLLKCHRWKSYCNDKPAANCCVNWCSAAPVTMPPDQLKRPPESRSVSNCVSALIDALVIVAPGARSCAAIVAEAP